MLPYLAWYMNTSWVLHRCTLDFMNIFGSEVVNIFLLSLDQKYGSILGFQVSGLKLMVRWSIDFIWEGESLSLTSFDVNRDLVFWWEKREKCACVTVFTQRYIMLLGKMKNRGKWKILCPAYLQLGTTTSVSSRPSPVPTFINLIMMLVMAQTGQIKTIVHPPYKVRHQL